MEVKEEQTKTEVVRLPSHLGDIILQRDTLTRTGELVKRDLYMWVPKYKLQEDDLCLQS